MTSPNSRPRALSLLLLTLAACATKPGPLPAPGGSEERGAQPPGPEQPPERDISETPEAAGAYPPGILLGFDDDYTASWERYFNLFDQYGAKVTFFLQGDYTPFWAAANLRGHEVAYHSQNHIDLRDVSPGTLESEALLPLTEFHRRGFDITTFAYPYGFHTPATDRALLGPYKILRGFGTTLHIYTPEALREGVVSSKSLDNTLYHSDTLFQSEVDTILRQLKEAGRDALAPLTTHDISDNALWGIKPARLEYLLKTASALGLTFYRYKDFFE